MYVGFSGVCLRKVDAVWGIRIVFLLEFGSFPWAFLYMMAAEQTLKGKLAIVTGSSRSM